MFVAKSLGALLAGAFIEDVVAEGAQRMEIVRACAAWPIITATFFLVRV